MSAARPSYVPSSIEDLPRRFADFLTGRVHAVDPAVWLAAALASQETLQGGACLDLRAHAGRPWPEDVAPADGRAPSFTQWMAALRKSPAVGAPGEARPLILTDGGRLYLHRFWTYEDALARDLARRARERPHPLDRPGLAAAWRALQSRALLSDGQAAAAVTAVLRKLAVVSGGAGTGKTTVVACILALLASQSPPGRSLRVRLAAPTGKAAGRLKEQLREHRRSVDPSGRIDEILHEEASTLHRLLGGTPSSTRFRHHRGNPLPVDALIIDETSMVDLPMLSRVVAALPESARLVLIGDKDQLPPVGVGSVFGDLCRASPATTSSMRHEIEAVIGSAKAGDARTSETVAEKGRSPLAGCITLLRKSFRFDDDSGIAALAQAIRSEDGAAVAALAERPFADLDWLPAHAGHADEALARAISGFGPFFSAVEADASPPDVLRALDRFRVLCAVRDGPSGVGGWNERIEASLRRRRRIAPGQTWYDGRPVLITRNDYAQRLWNGDVGVALRRDDGSLRVYFEDADGGIRDFPPGRLSHAETAYALTIHKSQGSEFDGVLLVLPEPESRIESRELLYTGVTRARRRLEVLGEPARILAGLARRPPRASGLAEALGGENTPPRPAHEPAAPPVQGELFGDGSH